MSDDFDNMAALDWHHEQHDKWKREQAMKANALTCPDCKLPVQFHESGEVGSRYHSISCWCPNSCENDNTGLGDTEAEAYADFVKTTNEPKQS